MHPRQVQHGGRILPPWRQACVRALRQFRREARCAGRKHPKSPGQRRAAAFQGDAREQAGRRAELAPVRRRTVSRSLNGATNTSSCTLLGMPVASLVREHRSELAGIIVEPFQRLIPPRSGFLEALGCREAPAYPSHLGATPWPRERNGACAASSKGERSRMASTQACGRASASGNAGMGSRGAMYNSRSSALLSPPTGEEQPQMPRPEYAAAPHPDPLPAPIARSERSAMRGEREVA